MREDEELKKAQEAVAKYGDRKYPTGEDRAALCHAAVIFDEHYRVVSSQLAIAEKNLSDQIRTTETWKVLYEGMGTEFGNRMSLVAVHLKTRAEAAEHRLQEKAQWAKTMRQSYEDELAAMRSVVEAAMLQVDVLFAPTADVDFQQAASQKLVDSVIAYRALKENEHAQTDKTVGE